MRATIAALGLFALLALAATGLHDGWTRAFFVGPDPIVDMWTLDGISRNLLTRPGQLFEGNNFFPLHDALLLSDPLLGPVALVLPFHPFTDNPVLLYNLAVLVGLVLTSYATYRLALRLCGQPAAALIGAVLVTYSPYQTSHMAHLNLLTFAGFPVLLEALLVLMERPGPAPAAAAGLAFAFQAGTSGYHAFSAAFLSLLVAAWNARRMRERRVLSWSLLAAALAGLLLLPYVLGFLRLRNEVAMERSLRDNAALSLDPGRDLVRSNSYLWRGWLGASAGDDALFPGLLGPGLALVALARRRSPGVGLLVLIGAFFLLLSLGPTLRVAGQPVMRMPFRWLFVHLPLFNAGRHPSSYVAPAFLALGLLAAQGAAELDLGRRRWLPALLLAAATAEVLGPPPRRSAPDTRLPEVYEYLKRATPGALFELPFHEAEWQRWSIYHRLPIVNGSSVFEPANHTVLYKWIAREWKRSGQSGLEATRSLELLKREFPIRYLVLHAGLRDSIVRAVEATPSSFERLLVTGEGDQLYRVRRGGHDRRIRRELRDDQLAAGPVTISVRAPVATALVVELGEHPIARRSWSVGEGVVTIPVLAPCGLIERGMNTLTLRLEPDVGELSLIDLEPSGARR